MAKMTKEEIRKATEGFNTKYEAGQILCDLPDIDPNKVYAPLPLDLVVPHFSPEDEKRYAADQIASVGRLAAFEKSQEEFMKRVFA